MLSIVIEGFIALLVICSFFIGLLKSRSRTIIHIVLFAGIFYGLRFIISSETQTTIVNTIFTKIGIKDSIDQFIAQIPTMVDSINETLTQANNSIANLNLELLPAELSNGTLENILSNFTLQFSWFLISFVVALIVSLLLSFIFNIPCKIAWNKRNTVYTTNDQGKEIKVKTKTKFIKRLIPAILNTVLTLFMVSCIVSPIYEIKDTFTNTLAEIANINTTELSNTIDDIKEKRSDYVKLYGETLTDTFFADIDSSISQVESIIITCNEIIAIVETYETSADTLIPDLKVFKFLTLIKYSCFKVEVEKVEYEVDDKLPSLSKDLVDTLNTDISKINTLLQNAFKALDIFA